MIVVVGTALFAYLVYTIGPRSVLDSFRALSWRLLVVSFFPVALVKLCDALAWRCALPRSDVPLGELFRALVAGQAVGATTPTGPLGGEAVKVWMLQDRVRRQESLASLIIVQTTSTVSQGCFLLVGILIARGAVFAATPLLRVMEGVLVLETIGVVGFVAVQFGGIVARGHGMLTRLGFAGGATRGVAAANVDQSLVGFYRSQPRRLGRSIAWGFLGWILGAVEVWVILFFLGASVSFPLSVVIEAFGTGISFATFFLPVQIGIDEGGAVATFLALGLNGATGLSLSLVRRVRELTWIAIGLLLLAKRPKPETILAADAEAA